jgi:hypothetical protein
MEQVLTVRARSGRRIIAGEPNAFVREIHTRMPVILPEEHYAAWLSVRPVHRFGPLSLVDRALHRVLAVLFQHAIDHVFLILPGWPVHIFSIENP